MLRGSHGGAHEISQGFAEGMGPVGPMDLLDPWALVTPGPGSLTIPQVSSPGVQRGPKTGPRGPETGPPQKGGQKKSEGGQDFFDVSVAKRKGGQDCFQYQCISFGDGVAKTKGGQDFLPITMTSLWCWRHKKMGGGKTNQ